MHSYRLLEPNTAPPASCIVPIPHSDSCLRQSNERAYGSNGGSTGNGKAAGLLFLNLSHPRKQVWLLDKPHLPEGLASGVLSRSGLGGTLAIFQSRDFQTKQGLLVPRKGGCSACTGVQCLD